MASHVRTRLPVAVPTGLAAIAALILALLLITSSHAAPTVTTDKADYYSSEIVTITGSGFAPNTDYDVPVIRPNGSIVKGNGSFSPGWDTVTSDAVGNFTYLYQLNGIQGTYEVRVYLSPWSGNQAEVPLAVTTFTDADIHFSQCQNDSDNNNVKDDCDWGTGAINQNNSVYMEGEAVPQRLFHRVAALGAFTMAFEYDFSKSDVYAYDFLTSPDLTQSGALLNECANRPGFVSLGDCNTIFGGNSQLITIPSDPFDAVSSRENPATRQFP